jgi:hypothetical protein
VLEIIVSVAVQYAAVEGTVMTMKTGKTCHITDKKQLMNKFCLFSQPVSKSTLTKSRFGYVTNTKIKFIIVVESSNTLLRDNEVRTVSIIIKRNG